MKELSKEYEGSKEEINKVTDSVNPETKDDVQPMTSYEDSDIDERIIRAVKELGFETMTPIQEQAIPAMLTGRDIIGQAQTGTGKTAAFGIPAIQSIDVEKGGLQCIILCPTRELAIQAAKELRKFAKFMSDIKVLPIYGGQDISIQIRSLRSNVSIVVGTPGRVMDHMRRHTLKLEQVKLVVLDEADEMLNMGFREDIETILAGIDNEHQTALFSATMPQEILDITKKYQQDAVYIKVAKKELTVPSIKQYYYEVSKQNKEEVVSRLLDYYNPKRALIFCNTKRMVDELTENLKARGYFVEGLHGDLSQNQRDKVMNSFRNGTVEILIATDVAARGIDVDDVEAVVNYDIPQDIEYYVHRIGRTGRAGKKGRSFTLVSGREIFKVREIERTCKTKMKARIVPSAADITAVKSDKILNEVMDLYKDNDLTSMTKIIEDKINDEEITALELAAAFLKLHMGDEIEDLPEEIPYEKKRWNRDDRGRKDSRGYRGKDGRDRDDRGYRGKDGGDRDDRGYRGKDGGDRDDRGYRGKDSRDRDDRGYRGKDSKDRDERSYRGKDSKDRDERSYRGKDSKDRDERSYRGKDSKDKDSRGYRGKDSKDRDERSYRDKDSKDKDSRGYRGKESKDKKDNKKSFKDYIDKKDKKIDSKKSKEISKSDKKGYKSKKEEKDYLDW